jgi:hypothetical protein
VQIKKVNHILHRFLRFEELSLAEARLLARRPRAGDGTMPLFNASLSEPAQKHRRGWPPKDQQAGTSGTAPGRYFLANVVRSHIFPLTVTTTRTLEIAFDNTNLNSQPKGRDLS